MAESYNKKGLAVTSLIFGILSVMCLGGPLTALPAIVLGHIALSKINKLEAGGKGLAVTGLILGYLSLTLFVIGVLLSTVFGVAIVQPIMDTIKQSKSAEIEVQEETETEGEGEKQISPEEEKARKLAMIQAKNKQLIDDFKEEEENAEDKEKEMLSKKERIEQELKLRKEKQAKFKKIKKKIKKFKGVLKTIDGTEYKGAKIMSVTSKGIDIISDKRLRTIKFEDLTPKLKEKFGIEDEQEEEEEE